MNSLSNSDCFAIFSSFRERLTKQLGADARFFIVVSKNGEGRPLSAANNEALSQQLMPLVEGRGWHAVGAFVVSPGGLDNEFGGALMKSGTQSIRVERLLFQQPTTSEDAKVFGEVIAAEVMTFGTEIAPR